MNALSVAHAPQKKTAQNNYQEGWYVQKFPLGVLVVSVNTVGGQTYIEDWNPRDAAKAKDYAKETACCGDVRSVEYRNEKTGEHLTFGPHLK